MDHRTCVSRDADQQSLAPSLCGAQSPSAGSWTGSAGHKKDTSPCRHCAGDHVFNEGCKSSHSSAACIASLRKARTHPRPHPGLATGNQETLAPPQKGGASYFPAQGAGTKSMDLLGLPCVRHPILFLLKHLTICRHVFIYLFTVGL